MALINPRWPLWRVVKNLNQAFEGGTEGQVLKKSSAEDYDFVWALNGSTTPVTTPSYTVTVTDYAILVDDDTAGSTVTVTLPPSTDGLVYHVKKLGTTANVIVDGDGSELIDGALTMTIIFQYDSMMIVGDGTGWHVI